MTLGFPQPLRVEPAVAPIMSGAPVSSIQTWTPIAAGVNWLNGFGAQLIPGCSSIYSHNEIASAATGTWHFYAKTRAQAVERVFAISLVGRTTEHGVKATVSVCGAAGVTVDVTAGYAIAVPYIFRVGVSPSSARTDLTVAVTAVGGHVRLLSVSCWEQYRVSLPADTNNHGLNQQSMRPGERVYVGDYPTTIASVGGAAQALAASDPRRVGIFQWAVPVENYLAHVGTSHVDVLGLPFPVLTRQLTSAQAAGSPGTGTVYWSAYAKVSAGTGSIQVTTSHSAVNYTATLTGTSFAWTTPRAILIDCEDMKTADGRRATAWDGIQFTRWNSGANDTQIASLSVWEE